MPNRASLLVRLSKQAGETNLSLAGMMADLRELAAKQGLSVVGEHVDDGISGAVRDRPGFVAWLDDARAGRADVLVAYHADRLTREGVNAAALVMDVLEGKDPATGRVERSPVRLVTFDGLDSERDAEAFRWRFVIAAEVARAERERIKARNLRTRERLVQAGRWPGGAAPFGCQPVTHPAGGKVLAADEHEAALLRGAAERLLDGQHMRAVVRWLNGQGSRTRRGLEWQRSSLRQTLLSAASREHVFDLATFRELEARLRANGSAEGGRTVADPGGRPRRWLLAGGLAVCGSCGKAMTTSAGRYVCGAWSSGETCPAVVTIKASAVDAYMEHEYLARYGDAAGMEARTVVSGAGDVDAAERAVEAAERRLLADLTPAHMQALQEAREALQEALAVPRETHRLWVETGRTWGREWDEANPEGKSDLLRQVLAAPVTIGRNPGGRPRGRVPVDLSRLTVSWRERVMDILEG